MIQQKEDYLFGNFAEDKSLDN
ncbi:hypothetical protein A2U01_0048226, partial [Trifolium medium]|nr:hypothetical protein [Trifolium medium]